MSSFCPLRWNLSSQLLVAPKLTAFMLPILGDIKICFVPILNSLDIWSWNVNPRESVKNRLKNTLLGLIDINPSINEFIGYAIEFESICNRKFLEKAHVKIKQPFCVYFLLFIYLSEIPVFCIKRELAGLVRLSKFVLLSLLFQQWLQNIT